ncbi:MAG TPA: ACT domain-containing protein [Opitutaceae bacterium]|nr:ACT domain-containing protein [Opitutaceae bacterium]
MGGTTDLEILLRSLAPALAPEEYVFATVKTPAAAGALDAIGQFREQEAITVICPAARAKDAGLPFEATYRELVLDVHSSLEAIGLLATVSTALAAEGVPCNVVSAFYHDHLFVPAALAPKALNVLSALTKRKPPP